MKSRPNFFTEENLEFQDRKTSHANIHLKLFQAARNRMVEYKIPQDAQWGDIDIMERSLDFTGEAYVREKAGVE